MLIGLDPLLSPDLLHVLASMGHGDSIVLVDANYPASRGHLRIDLPGVGLVPALRAVLSVMPLDTFVPNPATVMQVVGDPDAEPPVFTEINAALRERGAAAAQTIERHAFYAAAEQAFAIVATGERRFYGNVILTKGVIAPEAG